VSLITALVLPIKDILGGVEKAVSMLPTEAVEKYWQETVWILKMSKKPRNISRIKKQAFYKLQGNADLTVSPADKGNVMVICNTLQATQRKFWLC
jgi:hypothetical protein